MPGINSLADCILQGIDSLADCKLPGMDSLANFELQMILGYSSDKYLGIFIVSKSRDLCLCVNYLLKSNVMSIFVLKRNNMYFFRANK